MTAPTTQPTAFDTPTVPERFTWQPLRLADGRTLYRLFVAGAPCGWAPSATAAASRCATANTTYAQRQAEQAALLRRLKEAR